LPDGQIEQARYYHLRVSNLRRWSPAKGVQIVLLQVEEPGPDGTLQVTWRGDIPIEWRHQQLFPLSRTIGADADADVCSVVEGCWLRLHLLIQPYNLKVRRDQAAILVLTLKARGDEADSNAFRMKIAWDGQWHPGAEEMRRHLKVDPLSELAP
jgi:hypothetical protein